MRRVMIRRIEASLTRLETRRVKAPSIGRILIRKVEVSSIRRVTYELEMF